MLVPKSRVDFSPKNNFQELQLHQTLIFFLKFCTCQDYSILDRSGSLIFKKKVWFNFTGVLAFFSKYPMTSIHQNPKI